MPSARFLWNYLAFVCSIVAAVAASVSTRAVSDSGKVAVAATVAAPPLVVVVLRLGTRLAVLFGLASVAYCAWLWIEGRSQLERAGNGLLAAFELWPVVVAWCVAGAAATVATVDWVIDEAAREERARQREEARAAKDGLAGRARGRRRR